MDAWNQGMERGLGTRDLQWL